MLVFPLNSSVPYKIQDTWCCPSPSLFIDSWKDIKGSFPVMKQPLCLCSQHLVLNNSSSAEGRAQARWINVCCDCHISCWGVLCPGREKSLPLSDSSFKAKRQDDRWYQSLRSHRNTELDQVFWNVYVRVIKLLFIISKTQWESLSGLNCDCGRPGTTCLRDCREMAAPHTFKMHARVCASVCAHTHNVHTPAHTHTDGRGI